MGEEKKKKSDGNRPSRNSSQPTRSVVKAYKAPTAGLESVVFKMGTVQDAADFEEHKKDLGRYIAVNFKEGGSMLQQTMEAMVTPTFTAPADLINPTNVVQVKKWERKYNAFTKKEAAWDAIKTRGYQLILQHCNKDVEQHIESYGNWEVCNMAQDPIELLKLIRSALHKHDDIKQGTMAYVEQDIRLFTMWQKRDQSPLEFVKQVKAQADVLTSTVAGQGTTLSCTKLILQNGWLLTTKTQRPEPATPARERRRKAAARNTLLVLRFELRTMLVLRS